MAIEAADAHEAGPGRLDAALRVTAAIVGSGLAAVACSVLAAQVLPFGTDGRFAAGFFLMAPLWVAGMCFGFLGRSGRRTWVLFLAIAAVGAGGAFGISRVRTASGKNGEIESADR